MNLDTPAFKIPEILAKELARFLEEKIIYGEIPPETRLVEEEVVRQYQISRSPVREAFRILEQDGLLVRDPRRGVRVAPLTRPDLDDIYICRMALEGVAAQAAAQHRTELHLTALTRAVEALAAAFDAGIVRTYFERNVDLSNQILLASGNRTLHRLLGTVGKQALRYRFLAYSRTSNLMKLSIETNREIVDAIVHSRDRIARTLTEDLIHHSWQTIRQTFED